MLTKEQRLRLYEADRASCNYSFSPLLPEPTEVEELLATLSAQQDILPYASPDLLNRTDLSPAVMNYVRSVINKELPEDNNIIPEALTDDDAYIMSIIPARQRSSPAARDAYASSLSDLYNKVKSQPNKRKDM